MVNKKSQLKQWLIAFLKFAVASGLIFWLIQSGRFDLDSLKKISSPYIWIYGALAFLVVVACNALRWKLLLHQEQVPLAFLQSFRLSLIGIFFNFFMPGGVGGDVVKAGYLMRDYKTKKWFIGWSILVDRVLGMLALLLYSSITGLLFYKQLHPSLQLSFYTLSLMILMGFASLILILVLSPKEKINQLLKTGGFTEKTLLPLFYFFKRPQTVLAPFLLSLLSQGIIISLGGFLLLYLNLALPLWMILLIFPFGFLATIVPISPAGIGVGQAAYYYLFDKVAGNGEFGVLTITFFQAVQFLVGIIGGLLFVLYKKKED